MPDEKGNSTFRMSKFELLEDGVRLDGEALTFAELGTHICN
jgi:hypothetical protein